MTNVSIYNEIVKKKDEFILGCSDIVSVKVVRIRERGDRRERERERKTEIERD